MEIHDRCQQAIRDILAHQSVYPSEIPADAVETELLNWFSLGLEEFRGLSSIDLDHRFRGFCLTMTHHFPQEITICDLDDYQQLYVSRFLGAMLNRLVSPPENDGENDSDANDLPTYRQTMAPD